MNSVTPLIFRASSAQIAVVITLVLGCLLVTGYGMSLMFKNLSEIWYQLKLAQSQSGESTVLIWISLIAGCFVMLIAGVVLLLAVLALVLIEGTQVLVDEFGISVECPLLPGPIARIFGVGRLSWKKVTKIERRKMYFVLRGETAPNKSSSKETIKFLLVDNLEYLIFIIMERSPNLKLDI
ncbi:MAG: hypothetical protein LBB40_00740 [Holophagales bacterium]|jgi:predicted ABC-type exoprotein transport system permease subunit|nr:hypothetical protein [Holophagales bacterium]